MVSPNLPFEMSIEGELPFWRASTFWTKEPETLAWIRAEVQAGGFETFVDVGANVGLFSLYVLSLSDYVRVLAVEPSEGTHEELRKNLALNGWLDRAQTLSTPLLSSKEAGYWTEVSNRIGDSGHQFSASANGTQIESATGDEIVPSFSHPGDLILKIDVDGLDFSVLQGFEQCLTERRIRSLLIELDLDEIDAVQDYLHTFSMTRELAYESVENHSSIRRHAAGSRVRNCFFRLG